MVAKGRAGKRTEDDDLRGTASQGTEFQDSLGLAGGAESADEEREGKIDRLIAKGVEQGFVARKDVLAIFPETESGQEELNALYGAFAEMGMAVLENVSDRSS